MSKPNPSSFFGFLLWLALLLFMAAGVATAAPRIESVFSPLGVLPLLLGGSLGLVGSIVASLLRVNSVPLRVLGGILAGLTCSLGSHYTSYLWLLQRLEAKDLTIEQRFAASMAAPKSFQEYLQREVSLGRDVQGPGFHRRLQGEEIWILWGVEAALAAGAAAFAATLGARPQWLPTGVNFVRKGTLASPPPDWLLGRFDLVPPGDGKAEFTLYFDPTPPGRFGLETHWTAGRRRQRQWVWVAMEEYRPLGEWLDLVRPAAAGEGNPHAAPSSRSVRVAPASKGGAEAAPAPPAPAADAPSATPLPPPTEGGIPPFPGG